MFLFGLWVLSPFLAALMVSSYAERWAAVTRRTLHVLMVILAVACIAVYGLVAFGYVNAKVGSVYLVVPLAFWLSIALMAGTAALVSRREVR